MVAIIGHPGESMHTWKRFRSKASAMAWLRETVAAIAERHPARRNDATRSARVIPEKEAARARWRDGRRVYRPDAELEHHAAVAS